MRTTINILRTVLLASTMLRSMWAEPVPAKHPQGSAHGFAVLKNTDGKIIADGDLVQSVQGDRVTSRLTFRFRDGSLDDDTTVFSQRGVLRLISDHHIQRGPSFPKPMDVLIHALTGQIVSRHEDGTATEDHLDLPPDVSNGLPPNLLLNIDPAAPVTRIAYVATSPKPRLVHLSIKNGGTASFIVGNTRRKAIDYVVHVELGGLTGVVAPLVGKQPDDFHIWILPGPVPAFIREEGQMYEGGPIWEVEQVSPTFTGRP